MERFCFGIIRMIAVTLCLLSGEDATLAKSPTVLRVGSAPSSAVLQAAEAGVFRFLRTEDEDEEEHGETSHEELTIDMAELVRWSHPLPASTSVVAVLADGSEICLAAGWLGGPPAMIRGDQAELRTRQFGKVALRRDQLSVVDWKLPPDSELAQHQLDTLLASQGAEDQILLENGDLIAGALISLATSDPNDASKPWIAEFQSSLGVLSITEDRIQALTLARPELGQIASKGRLVVGLRDGSLVVANSLSCKEGALQIETAGGLLFEGGGASDVVFLQGLAGAASYLSDATPVDYQHEPYLEIGWPYRNDLNLLGGPLTGAGRRYHKGIAMHSRSHLTYDVLPAARRFAAAIALDDAAGSAGSVVFRVLVSDEDGWREPFTSGVVRGGDAPREVIVELEGVDQVRLVVDYADRGDQLDYANWLDARFER